MVPPTPETQEPSGDIRPPGKAVHATPPGETGQTLERLALDVLVVVGRLKGASHNLDRVLAQFNLPQDVTKAITVIRVVTRYLERSGAAIEKFAYLWDDDDAYPVGPAEPGTSD